MAELLFTTEEFAPHGISRPGVPMLLDNEMRLVEPACAWLLHIALVRGRTRSRQTWRTYGETLYDWWQTLEANEWVWDAIGVAEIAAYRDRMLFRPSDHTRRAYARGTINGRIRTLALFYRWCVGAGLAHHLPFTADELALSRSRPQGFLAHVDATGGRQTVNELTVRQTSTLPRPLSPATMRQVMSGLDSRNRLIVEWAVTTGMRRMEVAGLRLRVLPRESSDALTAIKIETTKGGKARTVYPPQPLVDRTLAYVREERAAIIRRAKSRNPNYAEPNTVFLTEAGRAVSARRVGAMFAAAATAAGVTASFHALRHTFATSMLRFLQRRTQQEPELNPLLTLQVLLGHADLTTTAIYLRVVATDLTLAEASVENLYEALL
ncbi:site-specific integrase [Mesorhizobium sp. M1D.F.Ca.ET.043.01.1.1]|uniref:tyrosine-type recombinase/integrase n=1 Tax=Mesorhizobium sp. M1D.F.Ca.ET.043.01.1.1 TaxID=2493669 RepID=UPI000F762123|nr:site-specific integrase [Mesorhizobium sp. M1D.F.Ca.ET.043.01.1.1]AZO71530.1 recombinase XerD [Mesorhizobium sp. M1D.F.Ca.ET.043.01.1.1]AZO73153.1 recombinase XerD [Mesorhizobium sp. M1D.F.Ca.ET.043.01.1.1]AZO74444.1 recombinase XerD [Mesorhizobium sp. M1D.F.Ca.ET.043.01.1.1]AZO75534.1 recombinase XerD [Mesorhizobium sp. M1D.F.Ca.ET.043.01.1.1]